MQIDLSKKAFDSIKFLVGVWTALFAFLTSAWILWLFATSITSRELEIDKIIVSKNLEEIGYSSDVFSRRIRDSVEELQQKAKSTIKRTGINNNLNLSDITLSGSPFSLGGLISSLKNFLPNDWFYNVKGEVISQKNLFLLRLRLNDKIIFEEMCSQEDLEQKCIKQSAFKIMMKVNPYIVASAFYEDGDMNKAWSIATEIINFLPDSDEGKKRAYNLKGLISFKRSDTEAAKRFYNKASDLSVAHINLGQLFLSQGNPELAESEYRIAIKMEPRLPHAYNNLGIVLSKKGDKTGAFAAYQAAIRLQPNYAEPHNNLGIILLAYNRLQEAEYEFREAVRLNKNYTSAQKNLIRTFSLQEKFKEIEEICQLSNFEILRKSNEC